MIFTEKEMFDFEELVEGMQRHIANKRYSEFRYEAISCFESRLTVGVIQFIFYCIPQSFRGKTSIRIKTGWLRWTYIDWEDDGPWWDYLRARIPFMESIVDKARQDIVESQKAIKQESLEQAARAIRRDEAAEKRNDTIYPL